MYVCYFCCSPQESQCTRRTRNVFLGRPITYPSATIAASKRMANYVFKTIKKNFSREKEKKNDYFSVCYILFYQLRCSRYRIEPGFATIPKLTDEQLNKVYTPKIVFRKLSDNKRIEPPLDYSKDTQLMASITLQSLSIVP